MGLSLEFVVVSSGVSANKNRENDSKHKWKGKFVGGPNLRRMGDVEKFRTLIWCRTCAGWTTSSKMGKRSKNLCKTRDPRVAYQLEKLDQELKLKKISEGVLVVGRRVPITRQM